MDITPYVDRLRADLAAAADAGGPEVKAAAERLGYALDPSVRLIVMDAVVQAAAEITAELPDGGVDVRLAGRGLEFVVDVAPPDSPAPAAPRTSEKEAEGDDDGAVARITLRLPESVKARAEELAARSGHSLNTWLVNVLRIATREGAIHVDVDLSSLPFSAGSPPGKGNSSRRMTGWR